MKSHTLWSGEQRSVQGLMGVWKVGCMGAYLVSTSFSLQKILIGNSQPKRSFGLTTRQCST